MNIRLFVTASAAAALALGTPSFAQPPRQDAIWARTTDGAAISLDGALNESAWAMADSLLVRWGVDNGIPGSGYKPEGGQLPIDPTYATLKFLTVGNDLYMGAVVRDSSVGGSSQFNRVDGFLIWIADHSNPYRPAPALEYTYMWWYPEGDLNPSAPGKSPSFWGRWANWPPGSARDATQIANWDAVTVVSGLSNSDATLDRDYTVEMKFNVAADGYDFTRPGGDVLEWSISVYDCDWFWPIDINKFSSNRTWWQNPWDNTSWYSEGKIFARANVTINSGPVPTIEPELRIPSIGARKPPVIDGRLTEPVWQEAPSFDIRYGDDVLREGYPGVGPFRSGQYQSPVNGGLAYVLDPGDATVRYFFKNDSLYLGFDVRDLFVQYVSQVDRWDGFIVTFTDRGTRGPDQQLLTRRLSFQVGPTGQALARDYLPFLRDSLHGARLALALKGGTTIDTVGADADSGYTAELALDLTKLGYPPGRGDGVVFLGITLLDGDSVVPFTDSYGTRTWWFRQYEGENGPVWAYFDPGLTVAVEDGPRAPPPGRAGLPANHPNPFVSNTTIRYSIPEAAMVTLEVYDLQGRLVSERSLGMQGPGDQHSVFNRGPLANGLYFYRLRLADPTSGATRAALPGKMMVMR